MAGAFKGGVAALVAAAAVLAAGAAPAAGDRPGSAGFGALAGDWGGVVSELGMRRYLLQLRLGGDGTGRAVYPGFGCESRLEPAPGGALVLAETVVEGREHCADGTVEIRPEADRLRWIWRDLGGEVRAVGTLMRAE